MRTRRVAIDSPNRLVIDGFVYVLVVDHDRTPLPGVLCELQLPDAPPRLAQSDTHGVARFPNVSLSHTSCSIRVHPRRLKPATTPLETQTVEQADDDAEDLDVDAHESENHEDELEHDEMVCGPPIDDGSEPEDAVEDAALDLSSGGED